jgi:aminoglycoside/choline kinase family phosphotransferase
MRDIYQFLDNCQIKSKEVVSMLGDASSKKYYRIMTQDDLKNPQPSSFILMHYPDENFDKFMDVEKVLNAHNILAPKVLHHDKASSLMLLSDFGDISLNKYLLTFDQDVRLSYYKRALDTMLRMQKIPSWQLKDAPIYTKSDWSKGVKMALNWYFPYLGIDNKTLEDQYLEIWSQILDLLPRFDDVFSHRDFHGDNILLTNGSIGIIDFQDCIFTSPIYDLVSLLDDARIDVDERLRDELIDYYISLTGFDKHEVWLAYNILGAHKNSRILGVFARKALQGNNDYVKFMPRTTKYLESNLKIPQLESLEKWMNKNVWRKNAWHR